MCTDGFIARCEISFGRNENHTHTRQPRGSDTLGAKLPCLFPPATVRRATIGSWIFYSRNKINRTRGITRAKCDLCYCSAASFHEEATDGAVGGANQRCRGRSLSDLERPVDFVRTVSFDRLRVTTELKVTNSRGSLCAQFSGTYNSIESTIRIEQFLLFVKLNKQYYQTFIAATCYCYVYSVSVCLVTTVDGFA